MRIPACVAISLLATSALAQKGDPRYVEDYEFLVRTIESNAAMPKWKGIDWKAAKKSFQPRFAACGDDAEHVRLAMELLAVLEDSHTGITRTEVQERPSKWDGLYGGGLWFGFDDGKWVLRGRTEGHRLDAAIVPGSILLTVDEAPAWLALGRERARVARFQGISSDASFFASISNRLLPFGESESVECIFLLPDGNTRKEQLRRWGSNGKAFDFGSARKPEGFVDLGGAGALWLKDLPNLKIGYLAITGSMNAATAQAFHRALDSLRGADGIVLDGRAMGGGGDGPAWEMSGRFFSKAVPNGSNGRIEPSGSWQYDGPVVYLQDELEVSSAETFTWALAEHDRVLSIGRPTGGWAIIPRGFEAPSGLFAFRLGVTDRGTPVHGLKTEGTGWPPDVVVPLSPALIARGDFDRELALAALACLTAGQPLDDVRQAFHDLASGDAKSFTKLAKACEDCETPHPLSHYPDLFLQDLRAELDLEIALAKGPNDSVPDAAGLTRRAPTLIARANRAGEAPRAKVLQKAVKSLRKEAAAQTALWDLPHPFDPSSKLAKAWLKKHKATLTAKLVRG